MNERYDHISTESAKLVLHELHRIADSFWASADSIDKKATALFGWASLLTGFVSALRLPWLNQSASATYNCFLIVMLALYAAIVIVALQTLRMREFALSIYPCWDIEHDTMAEGEKMTLLDMISTYNETILRNQEVVFRKGNLLLVGQILMALFVSFLVILATAPLWDC